MFGTVEPMFSSAELMFRSAELMFNTAEHRFLRSLKTFIPRNKVPTEETEDWLYPSLFSPEDF